MAYVTEGKFTEMEMVAIYGVLGDIVEGKEPQMALIAMKKYLLLKEMLLICIM